MPLRDANGYAPIHSYAAIGDGRSSALIAPDGSIDWWCAPCMDAPPLLDRLLDAPEGGRFVLQPRALEGVERHYREASNVLETRVRTATGTALVTESLNSGPAGRLPWSELARRVEGLDGAVTFDLIYKPGTRAGTCSPWMSDTPNGRVHHAGPVMTMLRYPTHTEITHCDDREVRGHLTLHAGDREVVALLASQDEVLPVPPLEEIDTRIDRSDREWHQWVDDLHCAASRRAEVMRSALALKFLWFSPTGAIAAAVIASLPERIGGDKNWDYRFAWVRDASASSPPAKPSAASWPTKAAIFCGVTAGCATARARSSAARSGWWKHTGCWATRRKPTDCSAACWPGSRTTSG